MTMTNYVDLTNFDLFYYYGENDLQMENESDLLTGLIQPKRSLFYNRKDGCGVSDKENFPNTSLLKVALIYDIINWIEFRNSQVQNGTDINYPDRRLFSSQNVIEFNSDKMGNLDINVLYIPAANFNKTEQLSIPITKG